MERKRNENEQKRECYIVEENEIKIEFLENWNKRKIISVSFSTFLHAKVRSSYKHKIWSLFSRHVIIVLK